MGSARHSDEALRNEPWCIPSKVTYTPCSLSTRWSVPCGLEDRTKDQTQTDDIASIASVLSSPVTLTVRTGPAAPLPMFPRDLPLSDHPTPESAPERSILSQYPGAEAHPTIVWMHCEVPRYLTPRADSREDPSF